MKQYKITVTVTKDITRIIKAKNDKHARAKIKRLIAGKPHKLSAKNITHIKLGFIVNPTETKNI